MEITTFYSKHTKIIIKALDYVERKIYEHYQNILNSVGFEHKPAIVKKQKVESSEVIRAKEFLQKYPDTNHVSISESVLKELADIMRSSLEIYKEEISRVGKEYQIEDYGKEESEIDEIIKTDILKNSQSNLFTKFRNSEVKNSKLEIFISYSNRDKKLGGKVRDVVKKHNIEVFLAHRDIPLSTEWRTEILNKLETCSHLIAICTDNYQSSAWGNQEVGIALEKQKMIIPIFAEKTNKTKFGFLEAKQGFPKEFTEENIVDIVEQIIEQILL